MIFKNLKKYFYDLFNKDRKEEQKEFVVELFRNPDTWKDYPTIAGGIGLSINDVHKYLSEHYEDISLVKTFEILKDLRDRQIIVEAGKVEKVPVYRAILWS